MTVVFLSFHDGAKTRSRQHFLVSFAFFSRAIRVYLAYNLTLTAPIWDFFSTWFSNEIARRMGHIINVIPLRYAKELHAL